MIWNLNRNNVQVPDHLWNEFKTFSPIFKIVDLTLDDLSDTMKQNAAENGVSDKFCRVLVGGMKAKNILLSSDLLGWYLRHGLVVSDVDLIVEFPKGKPFRSFQQMVTSARRQGDLGDSTAKVRADQAKLLGVSFLIICYFII